MLNDNLIYDKRYLIRCLLSFVAIMGLMFISSGSGFLVVIPFMFGSIFTNKPEKSFFWLLLTIAMLAGNQYLMPKNIVFAVAQRSMMVIIGFIVMLRVFGGKKSKILSPFYFMICYIIYMIIPSVNGWSPLVSLLKLLLFLSIYFAYLGISKSVSEGRIEVGVKIRSIILAFACFFIFGSIILIPFPGISQMSGLEIIRNPELTSLFKGMTMHSQCLGPVVASINAIVFADMLFSVRRFDKLYVALLICCPILIFKTSSRTGMGSYLLGMMYVLYLFIKARGLNAGWKKRAANSVISIMFCLTFLICALPSSRGAALKFITKWSGDEPVKTISTEDVVKTRQALIDEGMFNFRQKPMLGNGFQVSESMQGEKREGIASVLTAPIEKGVWTVAILEEGGVVGMIIFVIFLFMGIIVVAKRGGVIASSLLLVLTISNLGEFSFFSMSYTGGIIWALVFAGATLDIHRKRISALSNRNYLVGRMW